MGAERQRLVNHAKPTQPGAPTEVDIFGVQKIHRIEAVQFRNAALEIKAKAPLAQGVSSVSGSNSLGWALGH